MATPIRLPSLRPAPEPDPRAVPKPASRHDGELWFVLFVLTALYVIAIYFLNRRFVWFDELFTLDISQSASLAQLWHRVLKFDSNPPAIYLLSRLSISIFGVSAFALRLPSMLSFFVGSIALLFYLRRKITTSFAALAVATLWASGWFRYATEARAYAFLFMCFALLLLFWDVAVTNFRRRSALAGVALSSLGLLCFHVFAPLSLFPFIVAEAVRFYRRRQPDYALWSALLLPLCATLMYVPLIRAYKGIVIPPGARASAGKMLSFYSDSLAPFIHVLPVAVMAACLAFLFFGRAQAEPPHAKLRPEELALFACILLNPVMLNLVLILKHGGFYERYCITTAVVLYLAIIWFVAHQLRFSPIPAYVALLLMLALLSYNVWRSLEPLRDVNRSQLARIRPDLPIVDAGGMTFYEMNHRESPAVLARLHYLKDRDAALKYDKTNYFHDFEAPDQMKAAGFPIKARVEDYREFISQHREFIVWGSSNEWLLSQLNEDHATTTLIANEYGKTPYQDSNIYLVTIPQQPH